MLSLIVSLITKVKTKANFNLRNRNFKRYGFLFFLAQPNSKFESLWQCNQEILVLILKLVAKLVANLVTKLVTKSVTQMVTKRALK